MVQRRGRLRFALEAGVLRAVDLARPADAEGVEDLVEGEGLAGGPRARAIGSNDCDPRAVVRSPSIALRLSGDAPEDPRRQHPQELGRDVAIKFLRDEHQDEPAILHRFVAEARIGLDCTIIARGTRRLTRSIPECLTNASSEAKTHA